MHFHESSCAFLLCQSWPVWTVWWGCPRLPRTTEWMCNTMLKFTPGWETHSDSAGCSLGAWAEQSMLFSCSHCFTKRKNKALCWVKEVIGVWSKKCACVYVCVWSRREWSMLCLAVHSCIWGRREVLFLHMSWKLLGFALQMALPWLSVVVVASWVWAVTKPLGAHLWGKGN